LLGDLNVDLNNLRDDRAKQVATMTADLGLENLLSPFRQRRIHKGGFTWHMRRNDKIIKVRCDYILGSDWDLFTKVSIKDPRHFSSDHYMVKGTILSRPRKENKSYSRRQTKFPLRSSRVGPQTKADSIFDECKSFAAKVKEIRPTRYQVLTP
jgi:hypothetical protein